MSGLSLAMPSTPFFKQAVTPSGLLQIQQNTAGFSLQMNANAEFVSYISKTRRVLSGSRLFYSPAHTPHFSVV